MRESILQHWIHRVLAMLGTAAAVSCSPESGGTEPRAIYLDIAPTNLTISQGGSASVVATLRRDGDLSGDVSLSVGNRPPGITGVVSNIRTDGRVTTATVTVNVGAATATGAYTLAVRAEVVGLTAAADLVLTVTCEGTGLLCEQWAANATASSEYTADEWSAKQATGAPDVVGCADDARAWASLEPTTRDWLELSYRESVRPTKIQIHEVYGSSSIIKVELKKEGGGYQTVYVAQPELLTCPRLLVLPITGISAPINGVRLSFDQAVLKDWNEIDAVKLIGIR